MATIDTTCKSETASSVQRRLTTARDVDEHAQNLSAWNQAYDQISRGSFAGSISELWTQKAQIFVETTNKKLRQSCAAWEKSIWFGVPLISNETAEDATIGYQSIPANGIAIKRGGMDFELRTPDHFGIYGIVVDETELSRYAEEVEHVAIDQLIGNNDVRVIGDIAKQRLCQKIDALLNTYCLSAEATSLNVESPNALQDAIIGTIVSTLTTPHATNVEKRKQTRLARWKAVNDIREYVLANPSETICVPDLCERFHMSRRTLQYCFEEVTGESPVTFLRSIRLNAARRDLRRLNASKSSVAEIATTWGFNHFGQFSQDYRNLFGEMPSQTLRN